LDNVVTVALDWEVDIVDPPCSFGGWNTGRVVQQIFESLVEDDLTDGLSSTTRLVPALAEHVDVSEDGLRYRFDLRRNVRFHDGTPFDADAVLFNYARMRDPKFPYYSPVADNYNRIGVEFVAAIRRLHSHAVEMELEQPFPDLLRYMTQEDAPGAQVFVSPTALAAGGGGDTDNAPGTGPFKFEKRLRTPFGSGVVLTRNLDYWGGAPRIEELRFLPFPDASDRLAALLSGQVDLAYGLEGADLDELRSRRFVVHSGLVPYLWYLIFNMADPVLSDRRVRQAIACAFDRRTVNDRVFRGHTRLSPGMLPPASPSFDPEFVDPYPYDPARARALLAAVDIPSDWRLRIMFASAGSVQLLPAKILSGLADDLREVGLNVELLPHDDWVAYCNDWQAGMPAHIGISEMSWGMSCDVWLDQILHSRNRSPLGVNAGHCRILELDHVLDRARHELDDRKRTALYRQANAIAMDELPVLPVLTLDDGAVAHGPRITNFIHPRQNWHSFHRVEVGRDQL